MKNWFVKMSLAKRISIIVLIAVTFSTVNVGVFSYFIYRRDCVDFNADKALSIAQSVAAAIDPAEFREILDSNTKNDYWYDIKSYADRVKSQTGATYLYVLDKNYGDNVKYFLEANIPGEDDALDLGGQEPATEFADEMYMVISTGLPAITDTYSTDNYGMMVSGFSPIYDDHNAVIGVVGVDLAVEKVMEASYAFGIEIIACVIVFSVLFWLIVRWYIGRNVGKPIAALTKASTKIAEGDMDVELSNHSGGEIGELTASFQVMVNNTKKQIAVMENLAGGDLTVEVIPRSERDSMSVSMKKMIDKLSGLIRQINISTAHVSAGADQIADAAQLLAQGSTEQATTVEGIRDSITQIAGQSRENTAMADKAAALTDTIKKNAENGSQQMNRMLQSVNEINEASYSISKVIKVIDDIAFQTNILALNAAVESARAGQHGKGFAVVADEVRNLAAKSAEAAKSTGALITDSMEKAELGARIADETAASLTEIVSGINESNWIMMEIAQSSREQSNAIEKVHTDIDQVSQVVQQNSAMSEQNAAASEELTGQSNLLREVITKFELEEADPSNFSVSWSTTVGEMFGSRKRSVKPQTGSFALDRHLKEESGVKKMGNGNQY
jgi:methyl-accepting chemotaxis protein